MDVDQTGFIKGHSILENFVFATKLIQCCNKALSADPGDELDFTIAFDSVNWSSLLKILEVCGFPAK